MKAAPGTNPTRINHLSGTKSVWISQLPLISGTEERLAMDTSSQFSHVISGTEMGLEQRGAVAERVGVVRLQAQRPCPPDSINSVLSSHFNLVPALN